VRKARPEVCESVKLLSSLLGAILACSAVACGAPDVGGEAPPSTSSSSSSSIPPAGEARLAPAKLRAAGISVVPVGYQDLDRALAASGRPAPDGPSRRNWSTRHRPLPRHTSAHRALSGVERLDRAPRRRGKEAW